MTTTLKVNDKLLLTSELFAEISVEQGIDINVLRKMGLKPDTVYRASFVGSIGIITGVYFLVSTTSEWVCHFLVNDAIAAKMRQAFLQRYRNPIYRLFSKFI